MYTRSSNNSNLEDERLNCRESKLLHIACYLIRIFHQRPIQKGRAESKAFPQPYQIMNMNISFYRNWNFFR